MKLDILSFKDAIKYEPPKNSYGIRIFSNCFDNDAYFMTELNREKDWVKIHKYMFDEAWPKDFKEYSWLDMGSERFEDYLDYRRKQDNYFWMKDNLMNSLERQGHLFGNFILFDEEIAEKILDDFEKVKDKVENVMVHCVYGRNRSPAVGIAMNEIYGWGIEGLKEKFPYYRRYVYDVMKKVG